MIFVTGGTGFVGAHLLYHLTKEGVRVRALKRADSSIWLTERIFRYYTKKPDVQLQLIDWVVGDLNDIFSLTDAVKGATRVYHVAAVVSFHSNDKREIIRTNIQGTANLVNVCLDLKIDELLFVSSIGALGRNTTNGIINEETHFQSSSKNSVYSTTKYESEKEVWRGIAEGLNALIVNPAIVVGPGDWSKGSSQVFKTMWGGLKFYSTGMNGFIDVNDVALIMIQLMNSERTGERFILSTENVSYKQFFEWMAETMKIPAPRVKAGMLLSGFGWRFLKVKALITGKRSAITKETAKTARQVYQYDNSKLLTAININLKPIKESVEATSRFFLDDQESQKS